MQPLDDKDVSTTIMNAASPAWSLGAAAGRRLAAPTKIDEVADVLLRLLLDPRDTGVTQATAEALLARKDTVGLRHVLMARSFAASVDTADQISAALDADPDWLTTEGADRLIKQLWELTADNDPGVRDEAARILARIRPREEWADDSAPEADWRVLPGLTSAQEAPDVIEAVEGPPVHV
ncbi:hypothetical protein ABZ456_31920 [Streptomyces sp. NPDC005776]|uniref:hypothetical protein n=1 Tax=Streptomyces sp. NPDC005776 TaxID=3154676 RepID=UPI0033F75FDA